MDKNVFDNPSPEERERLAALEGELNGLDLIPLLERLQQRFSLSVNQVAVAAELDESALHKILNGEKRRFKPEHVDALLDDLETCGQLTDPAEKWVWHRALRVAAHINAVTYKEIEPILLKIDDPAKKAEALDTYLRNQYPALAQTHDDTGGLLPSVLPLVDVLSRRLHDQWGWIRVPDGYEVTRVTDDSYGLIGKGVFPKKISDLGPELEVHDTGFGTYTIRRFRQPVSLKSTKPSQSLAQKDDPARTERQSERRTHALSDESPNVRPSRLTVGDNAFVTSYDSRPLYVRKGPGKSFEIIARLKPGEKVRIIGSPVYSDGMRFWKIGSTTVTGWSAEADGSEYFLAPTY